MPFAQSMNKKWESKSGDFPSRSRKQTPGFASPQNKWCGEDAAELCEGDCAMLGKVLK